MTISYKVKITKYILGSLLPKNRSFELQVKQPKNLGHLYPFEFTVQHRATEVRKLHFRSSCQYTHGCCAPASWAARHTTVCLDTDVARRLLGSHDTPPCVLIHSKTAKLYKKGAAFKSLGEESCEIKGGGHELAAMMWMIMNFSNSINKM